MTKLLDVYPSAENHWRALILFGRNVATYKFALGRVLLQLGGSTKDLLLLEDLALPFAKAIWKTAETGIEYIESLPRLVPRFQCW